MTVKIKRWKRTGAHTAIQCYQLLAWQYLSYNAPKKLKKYSTVWVKVWAKVPIFLRPKPPYSVGLAKDSLFFSKNLLYPFTCFGAAHNCDKQLDGHWTNCHSIIIQQLHEMLHEMYPAVVIQCKPATAAGPWGQSWTMLLSRPLLPLTSTGHKLVWIIFTESSCPAKWYELYGVTIPLSYTISKILQLV